MNPNKAWEGEKAALTILMQVRAGTLFGDAQRDALRFLEDEAARAATAYARSAIENDRLLRHLLDRLTDVSRAKPVIREILCLGAARCLFSHDPIAGVNGSVELAKIYGKKGQSGYVNGVLRNLLRQKDTLLSISPDTPEGLALLHSFSDEAMGDLIALLGIQGAKELASASHLDGYVRIGRGRDKESVLSSLENNGFTIECHPLSDMVRVAGGRDIGTTDAYRQGWITPLSLASRMVAGFVSGREKYVLDVCAAPGGKALCIADLLINGRVLAADVNPKRVADMEAAQKRMQVSNLDIALQDGQNAREDWNERFDMVLVDAPCSGLGTFAHRPEVKRRTGEDTRSLSVLQKNIFLHAADYVRKGGRIIYSTCTFSRIENEDVVRYFLDRRKDFDLAVWDNPTLGSCRERYREGQLRLWSHLDGTDCFYIATMERKH